jgi:hypothetical protein
MESCKAKTRRTPRRCFALFSLYGSAGRALSRMQRDLPIIVLAQSYTEVFMAQHVSGAHLGTRLALAPMDGQDEVDAVLTALRELARQVTSPVVKACLDGARADIAHLTAVEDGSGEGGIDSEDGEDSLNAVA